MRWIVDAQLPPALARMPSDRGHIAEHVGDIGMRRGSDETTWDYAMANDAVIATKDEDFPSRALFSDVVPVIVWLRIGNCSKKSLLEWFEPLLAEIEKRIENGETLIEIR